MEYDGQKTKAKEALESAKEAYDAQAAKVAELQAKFDGLEQKPPHQTKEAWKNERKQVKIMLDAAKDTLDNLKSDWTAAKAVFETIKQTIEENNSRREALKIGIAKIDAFLMSWAKEAKDKTLEFLVNSKTTQFTDFQQALAVWDVGYKAKVTSLTSVVKVVALDVLGIIFDANTIFKSLTEDMTDADAKFKLHNSLLQKYSEELKAIKYERLAAPLEANLTVRPRKYIKVSTSIFPWAGLRSSNPRGIHPASA